MENSDLSASNSSYHAYMLRFWPEQTPNETIWRFTLLDPHSGQRKGFHSLDALFGYLTSLTTNDETSAHSISNVSDSEQAQLD